MGNQQSLSPRVAERVFEAVFPSLGFGTARGGRLPCKQDIQMGSIPIRSTAFDRVVTVKAKSSVVVGG